MKSKYIKTAGIVIGSLLLMSGACEPKEVVCNGATATYQKDIKPIVDDNCVSCHEDFNTYEGVKGIVMNGEFEHEVIDEREMPQGSKLSYDELVLIKCWLDNGAAEK
jgi:hypothetical protein